MQQFVEIAAFCTLYAFSSIALRQVNFCFAHVAISLNNKIRACFYLMMYINL